MKLPFSFVDKFKVEVKPPSLSLQYEDNANISCSAYGKRKLRWYKVGPGEQLTAVDRNDLINDDHYDTDGGSRIYHSRLILSINDATKKHAGRYKCVARSKQQRLEEFVTVSVRGELKYILLNYKDIRVPLQKIQVILVVHMHRCQNLEKRLKTKSCLQSLAASARLCKASK